MSESDGCVFCRLVSGDLPSIEVCADEHAIAVMDINPVAPGHVLVISREHAANLMSISTKSLQAVSAMAQRVAGAVWDALQPDGLNLLQANGPGAAQSVQHFHMHLIPRSFDDQLPMNWLLEPGDRDELREMAERLKGALPKN